MNEEKDVSVLGYNPSMVRRILLALYREENGILRERLRLSPPEMDNDSDEMLRHIDRMAEIGLVRRTHEIFANPPPDPVTLRPAPDAVPWARYALDDEQWEMNSPGLMEAMHR